MTGHDEASLGTEGNPPAAERKHRWNWRYTVLCVIAVIVIAGVLASFISVPYYALTPGVAQPVGKLIDVPAAHSHSHSGPVLLVDVELTPLRAIDWLYFELDSNAQIVSSSEILGPENASQYEIEGEIDMSDAQQAATVVALNHLGYHVDVREAGALIYAVLPDSPAGRSLAVGDVVTAVGGVPVHSYVSLGVQIRRYRPGRVLTFSVRPYPDGKTRDVRVELSEWRIKGKGKLATLVCTPYGTGLNYPVEHISPETGKRVSAAPCIGALDVETSYEIGKLPFRVNLSSEGIIGPSAGLAFTLGLMDRLDPYSLTGGHKVAATGTMSLNGDIGAVGGVAQKTIAVRASGAKIFFVPPAEYKVALAHSGGKLKIYPVSKISQVLRILERYGGRVPGEKG